MEGLAGGGRGGEGGPLGIVQRGEMYELITGS